MPKLGMEPIRKKQIINSVLKCIAEVGFDKVSIGMVATYAGVSKGVISYYFKNKTELLQESFSIFCEEYITTVTKQKRKVNSAKEALEIIAAVMLGVLKSSSDGDYNFLVEISQEEIKKVFVQTRPKALNNVAFKKMLQDVQKSYFIATRRIVEAGVKNKEFTVSSIDSAAYQYLLFIEGLVTYEVLDINVVDIDKMDVARDFIQKNFC